MRMMVGKIENHKALIGLQVDGFDGFDLSSFSYNEFSVLRICRL